MEISFDLSTADLSLITSGIFMTVNERPVQIDVIIDDEKILSVTLLFHRASHPSGKRIVGSGSEDGTVIEWHVYNSAGDKSGRTDAPVPVLFYEADGLVKAIYLQLHIARLPDSGPMKIEYAWWDGESDSPARQYPF